MDEQTLQALQANYTKMTGGLQVPQAAAKKRSGATSFLPMAASIIGGVGGTMLAPGLGTAAGGAAGGALGEWLAQKLSGEKSSTGKILTEGALGTLGGVGKGIRAIKGATTAVRAGEGVSEGARILRAGAPVATKVAKEGSETAAGGVRGWLGDKLLRSADNTALRASQLSGKKEALKGFDNRFGEDLGTYLRKNDLIGKTGKDVEQSIVKPLGDKYASLVGGIKRDVTSSDLLAHNQKSLEKLLYESKSSANKKLADDVISEIDGIFKNGALSPKELNAIKAEYQSNARNAYKLGANAKPGVDAKVAEFLKKTLQGVSKSDELAATGKEMDKAYKASDLLASAAQNGRGTLSLGLTDLMAAGGGGAVGSVPGAIAAVGVKRAVNSPKVQSFIANKLASAGEKLTGAASAKAAVPEVEQTVGNTVKGMIKAQAVPRIMSATAFSGAPQGADGGMEMNPNSPFNPNSPNYNPALVDPNAVGDTGSISDTMGTDQESPYSLQAMQADVMRDPKNADQYAKIYELMNPATASAKAPSAAAQKQMATAGSGLDSLDTLEQIISEGGVPKGTVVAGRGLLGGAGGRLLGTSAYDAATDNIADSIIRMRTGAAATKEEMRTFKAQLPQASDSPEVIQQKLNTVRAYLQELAAAPSATSGSDLTELMAAQ